MGFGKAVGIGAGVTCGGCGMIILILAGLNFIGQEAVRKATQRREAQALQVSIERGRMLANAVRPGMPYAEAERILAPLKAWRVLDSETNEYTFENGVVVLTSKKVVSSVRKP